MTEHDPFKSSIIARAVVHRLLGVLAILAGLWLAIAWAVDLP